MSGERKLFTSWLYLEEDSPFETLNVASTLGLGEWQPQEVIEVRNAAGDVRRFRFQSRQDVPAVPPPTRPV